MLGETNTYSTSFDAKPDQNTRRYFDLWIAGFTMSTCAISVGNAF
jgi:hypothetical protein